MSFSDRSELTAWQTAGCVTYALLGCFAIFIAAMIGILGGCPAFAPPSCAPGNEQITDLIFPVTFILVIGGGFGLLKFFKRERR
jgi:hypothetical protein